jgi:RNA polymerase sigma factor (TIGR02999 family)
MAEVTQLLSRIESGDPNAVDQLLPLVYDELRKLAAAKMAREKPGQVLDATELVHEAYIRLVGPADREPQRWDGRGHFFAAAAEAMRRILVENARRQRRLRHGGHLERLDVVIDEIRFVVLATHDDVLAVHESLDALERVDPQAGQVVKLRYFLGLSFAETASLLGISERSAYRTWSYARAWLFQRLAAKFP